MAPMFDEMALIGIGLIGSSIALKARREGLARRIVAATRLLEKLRLRLDKELKDEAGEYD